ncbi:MAG: acyl--CoA ligase [Magnetococcales bacterium]|nr:acyl--CoA ligase [Magnetococcales bacterium]
MLRPITTSPADTSLSQAMPDRVLTLLDALDEKRQRHPDKPFLVDSAQRLTYGESWERVNGLADHLLSSGVGAGDYLCLLLPRVPELVIAFLAAARIGALAVPVNFSLKEPKVVSFLQGIGPKVVVVHEKFLHLAKDTLDGSPLLIQVGGEAGDGVTAWGEASKPHPGIDIPPVAVEDIAYLNYTTGSSGDPKGAFATHANIYWNTRSAVEVLEMTEGDVHLCMFAPFAHPHELFARALYTGGTQIFLQEINPKTIVRTVQSEGVTCMMGLAPMFDSLAVNCADLDLGKLRFAESGGMFTRPDIIERFMAAFGVPLLSVWGSTETTGIAVANRLDAFRTDGSAGRICPYYDVRVVDDEGRDVAVGEAGELAFRGEGVIPGYDRGRELTVLDDWLLTGDIVRQDEEGYFYFLERKSGLIKVAGLKVFPLEVELLLQSHPGVREVAVIGVQDQRKGMVPKAFVVREAGSEVTSRDLAAFCREKMANYMVPKEMVFREALPKIGSGKIDKKSLA